MKGKGIEAEELEMRGRVFVDSEALETRMKAKQTFVI